ncbi:MAG TPA: hypothetical protein VF614_16875 [Chthoniobacteraceae bacterium]|jgi:hypothetical protein
MSISDMDAEAPEPPEVSGAVILAGRQTKPAPGGLRTFWVFEGITGDGKSVTFKDRRNSLDYGFDPGFASVDIKLHPRFKTLRDKFEGFVDPSGSVIWPATYSDDVRSGLSGLGFKEAEGKLNPMFGHDQFVRMEGTYRFRYADFTLGSAMLGTNKIFETGELPGVPPSAPGRNWLKVGAPYDRRGPVFDITELYWLSGEGGWPKPIYGGITSSSGSSSGGGGLPREPYIIPA